MKFIETPLKGAHFIELSPYRDERGIFMRTFDKEDFKKIGLEKEFLQMNHSVNYQKGTLRGLHFQFPPFSENKLIRCIRGKIWDVMVDLREESPTFLQHFGLELSEDNRRMVYIPEGFAHGFQTLEDHCEILYHHTACYKPDSEGGLRFDDPALQISWPLPPVHISAKDLSYPFIESHFKGIIV